MADARPPGRRPSRQPGRQPAAARLALVARLRAAGCVFAEDEARLIAAAARSQAELDAMADRRVAGEPLEHVVGWALFCGLRIAVDHGVFVPRRRTEFLVARAVARLAPGAVVVDLCCGSGAVGAAIRAAVGPLDLHAVDLDPAAVRCARQNLSAAQSRVYLGDLYDPLPAALRGRVDAVVANVPYVPSGDVALLPAEARAHEPVAALDGGADGLDLVRRVADGAAAWLAPGGCLLVETSERQAGRAAAEFADRGLSARVARSARLDASVVTGLTRVLTGR